MLRLFIKIICLFLCVSYQAITSPLALAQPNKLHGGVGSLSNPKESPYGIGGNDVLVFGIIKGSIKVPKNTNLQGKTVQQLRNHIQTSLYTQVYQFVTDTTLTSATEVIDISNSVSFMEAHTATDYVYNYTINNVPGNRVVRVGIGDFVLRVTATGITKLVFGAEWANTVAVLTATDTQFEGYNIISVVRQ